VIIGTSMYPLPASYSGLKGLQDQFNTLQGQLASGQKAATLADMGTGRYTDLTVRARLGRLTGYDANIKTVNLRLDMMNQVLTSVGTVNAEARSASTPGAYGTNNINLETAPTVASAQLDQVLSGLNADINGHYLFGGSVVDHPPVASLDAIMNGADGKAGFKTVAAQRLQADQGADGLGRLALGVATDTVSLAEDGSHPFGFKLSSVASSSPAFTLTQPTGTPPALSVQVASQPTAGDTLSVGLKLPDGTSDTVTLTAVTGTPANPGEFQIGATPDDTAANIEAALRGRLQTEGSTTLAVASNYAAADGFFNGQGAGVQRVAVDTTSNTYYAATGYETPAQTAADTVSWYTGEDSNGAARASVTSKVDDSVNVSYGAEASENGFARLVRALAVQSIQTYPNATEADTAASKAKFDAVANGQSRLLSAASDGSPGSIASIGVDLGLAQTTLKNLSDRHTAYAAQLQDVIGGIENADPTQVASALLELQTRLSASYSAVAMISQLQLANYLR
jgi:flagellin-like hook-associated protein FlgL